jgi:hypothetical protein
VCQVPYSNNETAATDYMSITTKGYIPLLHRHIIVMHNTHGVAIDTLAEMNDGLIIS